MPRLSQSVNYNGHTDETKLLQDFWDTHKKYWDHFKPYQNWVPQGCRFPFFGSQTYLQKYAITWGTMIAKDNPQKVLDSEWNSLSQYCQFWPWFSGLDQRSPHFKDVVFGQNCFFLQITSNFSAYKFVNGTVVFLSSRRFERCIICPRKFNVKN